eukprot:1472132-Karenia_brevis.AAC.1
MLQSLPPSCRRRPKQEKERLYAREQAVKRAAAKQVRARVGERQKWSESDATSSTNSSGSSSSSSSSS